MVHGRQSVEDMVRIYRTNAQRDLDRAQAVLAASDADFRVEYVEGVTINRNLETLQEGRPSRKVGKHPNLGAPYGKDQNAQVPNV